MSLRKLLAVSLAGCGGAPPAPSSGSVPYGAWQSPITPELAAAADRDLDEPTFGADGIYWLEGQVDGRSALMRRAADGTTIDVLPGVDVRSEAHAYGGGALTIAGTRVLYTNAGDRRLYLIDGGAPRAIAGGDKQWFVDCVFDDPRKRVVCVREDASRGMPEDTIVAIDLAPAGPGGTREPVVLASGHDFFAAPRLSPDGRQLAWLSWDLPRMPWTGTDLWTAPVTEDGRLGTHVHVAGGATESVQQPEWSPDGTLYFVSDRTDHWNIYRVKPAGIEHVWKVAAEVGRPAWIFDDTMFAFASPTQIVAAAIENGAGKLVAIDTTTGVATPVPTQFDLMRGRVRASNGRAIMIAASATEPESVIEVELATGATTVLARASTAAVPAAVIARAEPITFPTAGGGRGYAFYYPPKNDAYRAPAGDKPPLIVNVHGGPTGARDPRFNPLVLFWTSRGFGYVDVNYGGSSGYGRAYRERLSGQWGVVDVDDSIAAAQLLVARGDVDGKRLLIRGGSAGGYTTLAAMAFRDVFRAGASWFGIADLEKLDAETKHSDKFESGYTQLLVGPYPARQDLFKARSPIYSVDKMREPVIFLQGADDPVVPADQSRMMHAALRERGIPTAYIEFPGEKHGFRKRENNARALAAELYFYQRVLGLPTAGGPAPVMIDNLGAR
jgi:dipeptidyl aminopeptidase/acylaminoacyl peptidase